MRVCMQKVKIFRSDLGSSLNSVEIMCEACGLQVLRLLLPSSMCVCLLRVCNTVVTHY